MNFLSRLAGGLRRRAILLTVLALWFVAIGAGYKLLLRYAQTPGAQLTPPAQWPGGASIKHPGDRYTLVLFAHPECACTHATLGELARIIARYPNRVEVVVFVDLPKGTEKEWRAASLWDEARRLPARVLADPDGQAARLFGARTSGQTILFDPAGAMRFHGGITESRGHEGDNNGSDAVLAILAGEQPALAVTPVFGCALFGDS
jgi:hypothetical protein